MRLTKKQRAEVVELLRCTADPCQASGLGGSYARLHLGRDLTIVDSGERRLHPIWNAAVVARSAIESEDHWLSYEDQCLEAAQRVEDGDWP